MVSKNACCYLFLFKTCSCVKDPSSWKNEKNNHHFDILFQQYDGWSTSDSFIPGDPKGPESASSTQKP